MVGEGRNHSASSLLKNISTIGIFFIALTICIQCVLPDIEFDFLSILKVKDISYEHVEQENCTAHEHFVGFEEK